MIQDSLRKVEAGSGLVNRSGETLQGIVGSVKRVTDIVGEIAAASGEQSTGIEQVNTAMTQMDQVTQSNSAQTEELSATAQSLSEQAAHLMELVGHLHARQQRQRRARAPDLHAAHGEIRWFDCREFGQDRLRAFAGVKSGGSVGPGRATGPQNSPQCFISEGQDSLAGQQRPERNPASLAGGAAEWSRHERRQLWGVLRPRACGPKAGYRGVPKRSGRHQSACGKE